RLPGAMDGVPGSGAGSAWHPNGGAGGGSGGAGRRCGAGPQPKGGAGGRARGGGRGVGGGRGAAPGEPGRGGGGGRGAGGGGGWGRAGPRGGGGRGGGAGQRCAASPGPLPGFGAGCRQRFGPVRHLYSWERGPERGAGQRRGVCLAPPPITSHDHGYSGGLLR